MSKQEIYDQLLNSYKSILFNYSLSIEYCDERIKYDFDCPEYKKLIQKYQIDKIAGKGDDFVRAKRLTKYFAPKLFHSSYYDNHVPYNALDLLDYSFNDKEHGINCLNKAKILQESCLALGIKCRIVGIMPYSPFDLDTHVVNEIYDNRLHKWIMLDITTNGYFIDEDKTPLSLLEMRDKFAYDQFITFVNVSSKLNNINKLKDLNIETNVYFAKNLFYFAIGTEQKFGPYSDAYLIGPRNYDYNKNKIMNCDYRIENIPEKYIEIINSTKQIKEEIRHSKEPKIISSVIML